jgi:spermidine synthase
MTPWTLLDSAAIPSGGGELRLHQRADEFMISIVGGGVLMTTRMHGSEDVLAELACRGLDRSSSANVLIGGLGMGFTLASALSHLNSEAQVTVAELVPKVIEWNQGELGEAAGKPLDDQRVTAFTGDVGKLIRKGAQSYDAIILDVDNGPDGLTRKDNNWLYTHKGLLISFAALRPHGVLAVWSAADDRRFSERLKKVGFVVETVQVGAHNNKGQKHTIWLARRKD